MVFLAPSRDGLFPPSLFPTSLICRKGISHLSPFFFWCRPHGRVNRPLFSPSRCGGTRLVVKLGGKRPLPPPFPFPWDSPCPASKIGFHFFFSLLLDITNAWGSVLHSGLRSPFFLFFSFFFRIGPKKKPTPPTSSPSSLAPSPAWITWETRRVSFETVGPPSFFSFSRRFSLPPFFYGRDITAKSFGLSRCPIRHPPLSSLLGRGPVRPSLFFPGFVSQTISSFS